jgi:hypothetical protein
MPTVEEEASSQKNRVVFFPTTGSYYLNGMVIWNKRKRVITGEISVILRGTISIIQTVV